MDTNGKLQNASSLMDRWNAYAGEAPFEINMACRKRFFGTSEMIELLDYLAQYLKSMRRDAKLFVSDIAKQSGGPLFRLNPHTCEDIPDNETLSHKAHRNGLDADISFVYLNPKTRFFSYKKRDQEVLAMKPELKNNFTAFRQNSVEYIRRTLDLKNQFSLLKHAVKTGSVELMFIYPSVKEALCGQAAQEGAFEKGKEDREAIETLRRLIPDYNVRDPEKVFQWGHGDHVHVRLKCDLKSHPNCVDPASMVPASHGCRISTKP